MFAVLFLVPPLAVLGGISVFSRKFSGIALFIAGLLYVPFVLYKIMSSFNSPEVTAMLWGMPWTLGGLLISENENAPVFFGWVGLLINYLAVFAIVNFICRRFEAKVSQ